MKAAGFWCLDGVSDDELEGRLRELLGSGARVEARIVAHLAEVEARRIHLLAGRSSLYEYCQKDLGLSDYEAFCRIAAARVAAKYPMVFGMLERRELHLTAIVEVRAFLTDANHEELLREVSGRTKLQIREALARRFPEADVPTRLRKLSYNENRAENALDPLSADRYRLQLTIGGELKRKLQEAQELLSHANPGGDLAVVLERGIELLLAQLRKRRFGLRRKTEGGSKKIAARRPRRPEHGPRKRRHVPSSVRRQVAERDGERCAFVDERGERCECRTFLELHHKRAWALGGPETVDNLQLVCRAHNRLLAEIELGRDHVESAIGRRHMG
jgi:hypothetical protein